MSHEPLGDEESTTYRPSFYLFENGQNITHDIRPREIFINQQEITTLTVIWARQLVSPQPKLGPVSLPLSRRSPLPRSEIFSNTKQL